jgi:hypothetical protein
MPQKRRDLSRRKLLESRLSELVDLVKDLSPQSQVAISHAQYEDEDAHVSVYPPPTMEAEEVRRLELALGERCNDILVETGLFIVGAVCD